MNIRNFFRALFVVAACVIGIGMQSTASGAIDFAVTLDVGASFITIHDNAVGDADLTNGSILITKDFAGYTFNLVASTSNTPGSLDTAKLTLGSISITADAGSGPALVKVIAGATGYTVPAAPPTAFGISTFSGSALNGATNVDVSYKAYADTADSLKTNGGAGGSTLIGAAGPFTLNSGSAAAPPNGSIMPIPVLPAGYDMSYELDANFTSGAGSSVTLNGFSEIAGPQSADFPVPEPASLSIWAFAAFGMIALRRGRREGVLSRATK
jgi:hypothetical protein